ncbi:hypothetical protein [Catenuloplanes japonicus]|nr:hypothetical protein [Catenuloplanes japonicus]
MAAEGCLDRGYRGASRPKFRHIATTGRWLMIVVALTVLSGALKEQ